MSKKRWSWKKKLAVSALIVVLIGAAGFGAFLFFVGYTLYRDFLHRLPRVYTFPSAAELAELSEEQKEQLQELFLGEVIEIPESARDIYIWRRLGLDSRLSGRISFPSGEEAHKFAEELAGVPISEFRDGKTSEVGFINRGPIISGETLYWWNLEEIKRGKSYEPVPVYGRFTVIDLDTNTVYFSIGG